MTNRIIKLIWKHFSEFEKYLTHHEKLKLGNT